MSLPETLKAHTAGVVSTPAAPPSSAAVGAICAFSTARSSSIAPPSAPAAASRCAGPPLQLPTTLVPLGRTEWRMPHVAGRGDPLPKHMAPYRPATAHAASRTAVRPSNAAAVVSWHVHRTPPLPRRCATTAACRCRADPRRGICGAPRDISLCMVHVSQIVYI